MGLQDNLFPKLLARAEGATTVLTNAELLGVAATPEEGEEWTQLCNNHKYNTYSSASPPGARASLQATPRRNGPGSLQANLQEVCNTCWNKKHWIHHKASRPKMEQEADTSQNFSNQNSTTTTLKSPSQHGNLS